MAEAFEKWESRRTTLGQNPQVVLMYCVVDTDDDATAGAALLAALPATYGLALILTDVGPLTRVGPTEWEAEATYNLPSKQQQQERQAPEANDYYESFDTGGGTGHITQSIATRSKHPGTSPDFRGAIGVDGERVNGTDIVLPQYQFQITYHHPEAVVTNAYRQMLADVTGTVNDNDFKGFAAKEVLFLGASGSKRGNELWALTYKFTASPYVASFTQNGITIGPKEGHDYVWYLYREEEDTTANALVKRPIAGYVEQVYAESDFSQLGIGV